MSNMDHLYQENNNNKKKVSNQTTRPLPRMVLPTAVFAF